MGISRYLSRGRWKASRPITFAALALSLALFASSCNQSNPGPSPARANAPPQSIPVTVARVQQQDLPIYLTGLGSAAAYYTVSVKSRVDGQLVDIKFKEGEFVKRGELLAVIDPRPYQVQLDQAQAQLFRDQASLRDAQLNYERYKSLLQESGAMSQQQVDTQKATVDQLEGTVRNDQALVDNAKLNLSYCHIAAPESGRIGLRLVDPGNMVHATDANPMLVITQLQPITVLFTLPEDQLQSVAQQMRKGALQVDAYSRDDQTKLATGRLLTIDNEIDQTTGTGKLKAVFDNRNNELWPNQFVNVHLLLETQRNAIVVPAAAIQRGPQGNYVYAVKQDDTVERRDVVIATAQGGLVKIASGVSPGDVVVTDGQDKLQVGSLVQQQTSSQPSGNQGAQAPGGQGRHNYGGAPRTSNKSSSSNANSSNTNSRSQ